MPLEALGKKIEYPRNIWGLACYKANEGRQIYFESKKPAVNLTISQFLNEHPPFLSFGCAASLQ